MRLNRLFVMSALAFSAYLSGRRDGVQEGRITGHLEAARMQLETIAKAGRC